MADCDPVAITPPSDIVLGVALAADPEKYRAAAERLQRLSAVAAGWTRRLAGAAVTPQPAQDGAAPTADANPRSGEPPGAAADRLGACKKIVPWPARSLRHQSFIQSMLPKNAKNVFARVSPARCGSR
jgi:hypothetical protein